MLRAILVEGRAMRRLLATSAVLGLLVAVVAVARELVGFLWAVMRDVPTPEVAAA